MPYTTASPNLPKNVKAASAALRAQWVKVWNSAYSQAKKDGKSDKDAEGIAFRSANGVLKKREAHMALLTFGAKKTKTENGVDFPASAYAYVPDPNDPATWSVRLWESPSSKETPAQVDSAAASFASSVPPGALAGVKRKVRSAWLRVHKDARAAEMPEAVKLSANFSVRDDTAGEVHKWGKIFEAGEYKAHKFAMTPAEVDAAVEHFEPCDLNIQHGPSILDGTLGRLEDVEAEDGVIFGHVVVPTWLEDAVGDKPFTVSTEWNRATKRLGGLAIEIDPAVEDAVLFAAKKEAGQDPEADEKAAIERIKALPMPGLDQPIVEQLLVTFATRHDTYSGQSAIQDIHDTAARYGGVCVDPGKDAKMQSKHESTALQAVHDMMTEHGAKCSSKTASSVPWMFKAEPIVHDGDSDAGSTQEKEPSRMSKIMDEIKAMLARAGVDPDADTEEPKTPATTDPKPSTEQTVDMAANTEITRLRAENARLQAERQTEAATKFADDLMRDGKITPAEVPALVEMHIQAAQDDLVTGKVMLANGQHGTRLDKLAAVYAAKPKFNLADERLKGLVHTAIVNLAQTDEAAKEDLSAEKIRSLAEATPAGRAAFAAKNGAAGQ